MEYHIKIQDTPESRMLIHQLMALQARVVKKVRPMSAMGRPADLTPYFNDKGRALEYHHVESGDANINSIDVPIGEYLLEN